MSGLLGYSSQFLDICVNISLAILTVSFFLIVVRIVRGPTLPDRVVALDMLVAVGIGFIAAIGVQTDYFLYVDIAIALGLVGFLATVAFARFVLNRGLARDATIVDEISQTQTEGEGWTMIPVFEIAVGVVLVVGSIFSLIASIGLLRLKDVYMRMHAGSKAGTLGSGLMLIALAIHAHQIDVITRALAGVVFFLLTAPVAAHLLAKAAYEAGYRPCSDTHIDEMPKNDD